MRFSLAPHDARIHALVVGARPRRHADRRDLAAVGEAAEELGLARPSYHTIRELVRAESSAPARRGPRRVQAALDAVLGAVGSSRVVDLPIALDALEYARAKERLVSDRHKPP